MTKISYFPRTQAANLRLILAAVLVFAISMLSIGQAVHAAPALVVCDPIVDYCPPENDQITNAKTITLTPNYSDTQNILDAGGDPTDPQVMKKPGTDCDSNEGQRSVWYQYTPTQTQYLFVDTLDSTYNTLVSVWSPKTSSLSYLVACNNLDPRTPWNYGHTLNTSALAFTAYAGQTYYIEVILYVTASTSALSEPDVIAVGDTSTLTFNVQQITPTYASATFISNKTYDGYILEKSETSNKGGSRNYKSSSINVGDDDSNRQYKGYLHFDTSTLRDDAVITSAQLQVKRAGVEGTLPFRSHRGLYTDIRLPYFGSGAALQTSDFQAAPSLKSAGKFLTKLYSGWYKANLSSTAFRYINLKGTTQFCLRFNKDDNNDFGADYLKLYSGNSSAANRPKLVVSYYYLTFPAVPTIP